MNQAVHTDIDIDFADREKALLDLPHISASMVSKGQTVRHPTGVYFQDIPVDPTTSLASINYDQASDLGYFKIDLLNNHIYENVRDEEHLDELVSRDPPWDFFEIPEVVSRLAHIHNHFGVVQAIRPRSIEDLAVVLALMRPGKRHLLGKTRADIDAEIWLPDDSGYSFKRSHSFAYALSIVVQLNLLCDQTAEEIEAEETGD